MIILLDTSTPVCYLTVIDDDKKGFFYEWEAGKTLARGLLRFLEDKLGEHGSSLGEVSAIAVMKGPGSFTGLRIGITVVNTLAESLGVPIVGVDGEHWRKEALVRLEQGKNDQIVLPNYGSEANITKPRK